MGDIRRQTAMRAILRGERSFVAAACHAAPARTRDKFNDSSARFTHVDAHEVSKKSSKRLPRQMILLPLSHQMRTAAISPALADNASHYSRVIMRIITRFISCYINESAKAMTFGAVTDTPILLHSAQFYARTARATLTTNNAQTTMPPRRSSIRDGCLILRAEHLTAIFTPQAPIIAILLMFSLCRFITTADIAA